MSTNASAPAEELLPPYLPPRRPKSLPDLAKDRSSWRHSKNIEPEVQTTRSNSRPRKLTKRKQQPDAESPNANVTTAAEEVHSRPTSYQSFSSGGETAAAEESGLSRRGSNSSDRPVQRPSGDLPSRTPSKLASIPDGAPLKTQLAAPTAMHPFPRPAVLRNSSLRIESKPSDEDLTPPNPPPTVLGESRSDPQLRRGVPRPHSHPTSRSKEQLGRQLPLSAFSPTESDSWKVPSLPPSRGSTPPSQKSPVLKPRASFKRLSSLDQWMTWRDERAEWKRASLIQQASSEPSINEKSEEPAIPHDTPDQSARPSSDGNDAFGVVPDSEKSLRDGRPERPASEAPSEPEDVPERPLFRHPTSVYGFCTTICIMQLLAEYLITGFAIELPSLVGRHSADGGAMGLFWPAVLLTLILGATLLVFARLSDEHGGYPFFMFGVLWLAIWTLIPGFTRSMMVLNVSRAMQGLAIAAYTPSIFTLTRAFFPDRCKRNLVMGFFSGCAPVGFFAGFLVAGALPNDKTNWYFWTASIASFATAAMAFASIPHDRTDRAELQLKMDWIGAFLITAGLILLAYALSVEPYVTPIDSQRSGFSFPTCYGPLVAGVGCLSVAFWWEGWMAKCPLVPFDFFKPKSVKAMSLAGLCFYASYGGWLYNSAEFFQSPSGVTRPRSSGEALSGLELALWYAPTAIGGIVLCVVSSSLIHRVRPDLMLLLSALAWVAAPLFLALSPLPLNYLSSVLPSMLCATIGLDLTYTISIIFLSSAQPVKYQGLSGAVASSLINLGMSFALPISEIAMKKAQESVEVPADDAIAADMSLNNGYRATFYYATASAGLGLIICALFVRVSSGVVSRSPAVERPQAGYSESTLVGDGDGQAAAMGPDRRLERRRESV